MSTITEPGITVNKTLMRALKSRLAQPVESTELTEEEIAFLEEEEAVALATSEASSELCEHMAKYANLGDPLETHAFLRDFSSWVGQKKQERTITTDPHRKEDNT